MFAASRQPLTVPPDHLGVYLHIPFCVRKCTYCDFVSQPVGLAPALVDRYLTALIREAELRRPALERPVHSIYIGGGTPTTLTAVQLKRLWEALIVPLPRLPHAEITLEANPGTLTPELLALLAELPITRVSLGAQSFQAAELATLGRIHAPEAIVDAVTALRAVTPAQINLDLMYALPGQTVDSWEHTMRQALALAPDHLSCYALIIEDQTPLAAQIAAGDLVLPGEEAEETMGDNLTRAIIREGLVPYEVSNAARLGAHSRHNLGYWLGRDYLGLGAGAVSALQDVRWRNTADVGHYAALLDDDTLPVAYAERLAAPERLLERVMLGLRLHNGFDLAAAEEACGCILSAIAGPAVRAAMDDRLLERVGPVLRLSARGFAVANTVSARLMAGADAGV